MIFLAARVAVAHSARRLQVRRWLGAVHSRDLVPRPLHVNKRLPTTFVFLNAPFERLVFTPAPMQETLVAT